MKPTVKKAQLLETLRANRARHVQIVKEARAGYVAHATKLVEEAMLRLHRGEFFPLRFELSLPRDYTEQYDAAIAMIEWNQAEEITLDEQEFQTYVLDKWRWGGEFYGAAAGYSGTAAMMFSGAAE